MTNCVVYYNTGTANLVRLVVSLYTLRKVWFGRVVVVCEGPQPRWARDMYKHFNVEVQKFKPAAQYSSVFTRKPEVCLAVTHTNCMYIDSDTVICKPINQFFEYLKTSPMVIPRYSKWHYGRWVGRRWYKRFQRLGFSVNPKQELVNMGVLGWTPAAQPLLKEWSHRTQIMDREEFHDTDEIAMGSMLPNPGIKVVPHCWNQSARISHLYDELPLYRKAADLPRIFHFHGGRHFRWEPGVTYQRDFWLRMLEETKQNTPFANELSLAHGDYFYQKYLDCSHVNIITRKDFPKLINAKGYVNGAEIGVSQGRYSELLLRDSRINRLFSIDIWNGKRPGWMGSEEHMHEAQQRMKKFGDRSIIIRDFSAKAAEKFLDEALDFIYLDAGHSYQAIETDLYAWWPKLKPGGCFAGHDWTTNYNWGVQDAVRAFALATNRPFYLTVDDEPETHESWYMFK